MGLVTLGIHWAIHANIPHWQTIAFTVLCFSQMGHVMAIRSDENLFKIGPFSNKPLLGAPNCLSPTDDYLCSVFLM
jgi:Ca2+-transporting ATPase